MLRSITRCTTPIAARNAVLRALPIAARHFTTSRIYFSARPQTKVYSPPALCGFKCRPFSTDTKLGMPALSPTMTEGSIAQWKKKEGDKISAGDIIAEVETDKATIDFEAQDDGYLAKILVPSGTKDIPVNKAIAILVDSASDVEKFKTYSGDKMPKADAKIPAEPKKVDTPAVPKGEKQVPHKNYPSHIKIGMPALSPTMTKGDIAKWRKKAGDSIKVGESIAEIVTGMPLPTVVANLCKDKASMDFESQEEGYMAKILVEEGAHDVPINRVIAIMVDKQSDVAKFADFEVDNDASTSLKEKQEQPEERKQTPAPTPSSSASSVSSAPRPTGDRIAASPLAKTLAREKGIDLSQVSGTGPNSRIIKADILEFAVSSPKAKEPSAAPVSATKLQQAAETHTDIPVSNIRKVTAQRLLQSKQTIPHYYLTMEMRVDQLMKLRGELNAQANGKYKLSVNDFIIKAAALALQKVPIVNSSWNEQFIRRYHNIDINVAVNTEQGLFTPIVKDADKKGLASISNSVKSLADKAKENKLQPAEFQGGTFTISNLGMFGISHFSAVINPPQAAILAVGGVERRLVPKEGTQEEGQFDSANILSVTLSCDHRVVDGAVGAEWLRAFKEYMETPTKMLL